MEELKSLERDPSAVICGFMNFSVCISALAETDSLTTVFVVGEAWQASPAVCRYHILQLQV